MNNSQSDRMGTVQNADIETGPEARISQAEIGSIYDRISTVYNLWGRFTESRARRRALVLADIRNGHTCLEVAVGTGTAFADIVKNNPEGTNIGIDLSPGMLDKARERMAKIKPGNYTLIQGSAFHLEVKDTTVDVLLNQYMFDLMSFKDMDTILREFHRVLNKDGKLIVAGMTEGERFGSHIYQRLYNRSPRLMGGCRGIKLADRLRENGFQVILREYIQQMFFPSEVILAKKI